MRIGIITMHRVPNYGSFLQAYAMKKVLENYDHSVVFIDFKPGKVSNMTLNERILAAKNKLLSVFATNRSIAKILPSRYRRLCEAINDYNVHFLPYLDVSKRVYSPEIDVLLLGSDEVFNCTQRNPAIGYSKDLFGANAKTEHLVSYAASFGNTTLEMLDAQGLINDVANMLSQLKCVSLRDTNSVSIYQELTGKTAQKHIDPVLLYPFKSEIQKGKRLSYDFAILYSYPGRMKSAEIDAVKQYVSKAGLKLVCFPLVFQADCDDVIDADPFEVLEYFQQASCVFTDTFHGTIFSIISKRPFATFVRKSSDGAYGNEEKIVDLLKTFGLQGRIVNNTTDLAMIMNNQINYVDVHRILDTERANSHQYLQNCMLDCRITY